MQGLFRGHLGERLSIAENEANKQESVAGDANSVILSSAMEPTSFAEVASEGKVEAHVGRLPVGAQSLAEKINRPLGQSSLNAR